MPGDSEHPVTVLGDLRVNERRTANHVTYGRPATVADLVSALRAEGVLVVEKVEGEWPDEAIEEMEEIVARHYIAAARGEADR